MTCKEYREASERLRLFGVPFVSEEADLLLRTVKGIDSLRLFGMLLKQGCVTAAEVGLIGLSLAHHFLHDGYSFALYELYQAAGEKLCSAGADEYVCMAADIAAQAMNSSECSFEHLEFLLVCLHPPNLLREMTHLECRFSANLQGHRALPACAAREAQGSWA